MEQSANHETKQSGGEPEQGSHQGSSLNIPPNESIDNNDSSFHPLSSANHTDPMLAQTTPSHLVREGDWVLLYFSDGRKLFAQALRSNRGRNVFKISKRTYSTYCLIGQPYGTVLEVSMDQKLVVLPQGEDIVPGVPRGLLQDDVGNDENDGDDADELESTQASETATLAPPTAPVSVQEQQLAQKGESRTIADNRHLVDNNKAQTLTYSDVLEMRAARTSGSDIVQKLIESSTSFQGKTEFSKAKYIKRKQQKHQIRCRMVRCTGYRICEAMHQRDARKILNLRQDTLGQILSYANVTAGAQVLVLDQAMGIITGSLAQRMGGYGKILSMFEGQQPSYIDQLERFNLTFSENYSIKWVHFEDIFGEERHTKVADFDPEGHDRDSMTPWPCPLQPHTRNYIVTDLKDRPKEQGEMLAKRCNRFARKLTRTTPAEAKAMLNAQQSDSVILCGKYEPTSMIMVVLPFLKSSCPFVIYSEFLEPLAHTFLELQDKKLALNLRLTDTWLREYQVLEQRTHPMMHMTQNGGFLLFGIKRDPVHGNVELAEEDRKRMRDLKGPRRGKKNKSATGDKQSSNNNKRRRNGPKNGSTGAQEGGTKGKVVQHKTAGDEAVSSGAHTEEANRENASKRKKLNDKG